MYEIDRRAEQQRAMRFLWETMIYLPSWMLILAVRCYQVTLSRFLGGQCRFYPTCSNYFIGAVRKHGAILGAARGLWRICRCHPFHPGGFDPP